MKVTTNNSKCLLNAILIGQPYTLRCFLVKRKMNETITENASRCINLDLGHTIPRFISSKQCYMFCSAMRMRINEVNVSFSLLNSRTLGEPLVNHDQTILRELDSLII